MLKIVFLNLLFPPLLQISCILFITRNTENHKYVQVRAYSSNLEEQIGTKSNDVPSRSTVANL